MIQVKHEDAAFFLTCLRLQFLLGSCSLGRQAALEACDNDGSSQEPGFLFLLKERTVAFFRFLESS